MRPIVLFLCFAALAPGQVPVQQPNPCLQQACYFGTVSATVASSADTTLTVQLPATSPRQVNFIAGVATCDGQSFTVTQSQKGTAASATAGTANKLIPTTATASALVFTASNVGSGTPTAPVIPFASGSVAIVDLSMRTTGTAGDNYSIKVANTGSGSCTATISIYWSERI